MQSSFRISKVVLSKFGTAASFGFGLNAGARYADSQSGHRLAIEEAQLRHLHMRPRAGSEGLDATENEHEHEVELDVDRSSLLLGYSCFSPASLSHASSCMTQNTLVESKRPADLSGDVSSRRRRSSENNHVDSAADRDNGHEHVHQEASTHAQLEIPQHRQHPNQYQYLERKQSQSTVTLPPMDDYVIVQKECDTPDDKVTNEQKELPEFKYEEFHVGGKAENLSWNSLVEADQCSICADLLAGEKIALLLFVVGNLWDHYCHVLMLYFLS